MTDTILVIDDEADIREVLSGIFEDEGYRVLKAAHSEQAFHLIEKEQPDLIVLDIWLENSDLDGVGILKQLKKEKSSAHYNIPVLMISGHGNIEMAVKAMKIGAYDFIEKPFKIEHILLTAERALKQHHLLKENTDLKHKVYKDTDEYKTKSPALQALIKRIQDDFSSDARVMVLGEIGTGKSKLARYIHQTSLRCDAPLYVVQAQSIDKDDIKNWFNNKDYAQSTIIIERIERLEKTLQTTLLKELSETQSSNAPRLICTTSNALQNAIKNQEFSSALSDRLAVLTYETPSLRDRIEDFPEMMASFASNICLPMNLPVPTFSSDAILFLQNHQWKGNIAQLKCLIELVALGHALGKNPLTPITAKELSKPLSNTQTSEDNSVIAPITNVPQASVDTETLNQWLDLSLRDARENFETFYLSQLLNKFHGNISQMASHIDMERTALHRKLKSMDIRYNNSHPQKTEERQAG